MRVNSITSKLIGNIPQRKNYCTKPACYTNNKAINDEFTKSKEVSFKAYYFYPVNIDDKMGIYYDEFINFNFADKFIEDGEATLRKFKKEYEETKREFDNNNYKGWCIESVTTGRHVSYTGYSREHSTAHMLSQISYLISGGRGDLVAPYFDYITNDGKTAEEAINDPKNQNIDLKKYMGNFGYISCKNTGHSEYYLGMPGYGSNKFNLLLSKAETNIKKFIEEKLKEGNIGELKSKYPQFKDVINQTLGEMGLDNFGNYKKNIDIQYPALLSSNDFKAENETINESIKKEKRDIKKNATLGMHSGIDRMEADLVTLGLYELYRAMRVFIKTRKPVKESKEKTASKRKALADKALQQAEKYEISIKGVEEGVKKLQALQDKEEKIKEILTKGLVSKINNIYQGIPVRNMPNCVMFEGENPFEAKEMSKWVHYASDTNFNTISSNVDKELMKKDIYEKLKKAEKDYKETGKRTILFVEGMDKLLIEKENSNETIAWMKLIMQCASEKYHSTIMFFGVNPDKYATGINTRGRIGLKVPVDISIEEANVQNMFKF